MRGILQRRDRVLIGREAIQLDVITRTLGPAAPRLLSALAQRSLPDELKRDNAKGPPGSVKPKEAAPPNPESSAAQNGATVEAGTSS